MPDSMISSQDSPEAPLRLVLWLNSLSCLAFGACFAAFPRVVNVYVGGTDRQHLLIALVGAGLIFNGLHLFWASLRRNLRRMEIIWFSLGDFLWVLASVILLLFGILVTTPGGVVMAAIVSFLVFSFGVLQLSWLRLLGPHSTSIEVPFEGSTTAMWRTLADFSNVYKFHPLVARTELRSHQQYGVGAVRHCWHRAGGEITETVIDWKDGEGLAVRYSDHKLPVKPGSMTGRVWIVQQGEKRLLRMEINYVMKWGLLGVVLGDTVLKLIARRELRKVVEGYVQGIEHYEPGGTLLLSQAQGSRNP